MVPVDDAKLLREKIRQLEEVIAEQEEQICQFREMLKPPAWAPPVEIGLTTQEARLIATLYKAKGELVNRDRIFYALYHDVLDQPEIKIVDVYVCKARKKLAKYDIHIKTVFGQGFYLEAASMTILKEWGLEPVEEVHDQLVA